MVTTNNTNTYIVAPTTWEVTMPNQPSFAARTGATQADVTGDASTYTCQFTTENYDQGGDFDGTSTFTAPVTANYLFSVSIRATQLTAAMTSGSMTIVASGYTWYHLVNPGSIMNSATQHTFAGSINMRMVAASTCIIYLKIDSGTKVVDIVNSDSSAFAGTLVN